MPQTTSSDAQAPATATPAPGQPVVAQAPTAPTGPISREQAEFLRAKRSALSSQLESVQERRDDVANRLRNDDTQASERPGLENRLQVLDERLVQLEKEIASNSEQLANAPPRSSRSEQGTGAPARGDGGFMSGANPNLITIFSFALLMPFAIQIARRTFGPKSARFERQQMAELTAARTRMEKLESDLDAVAIEVERIGEGQRFLTQAMTENIGRANLAAASPAYEGVNLREAERAERR